MLTHDSDSDRDPGPSVTCRPGPGAARVYGVNYRIFEQEDGGTLYVTPHGLPMLEALHPSRWYADQRFAQEGRRLASTVYRLAVADARGRDVPLVVKFSRFATDVPLDVHSTFDGAIRPEDIERARFLDPFQEFGLLHDLRRGRFGPPELRIRTKRPLAIYRTPDAEPAWRLGRKRGELSQARWEIAADQAAATDPVSLDGDRVYVVLYHWVDGLNLIEAMQANLISTDEVTRVTRDVATDLRTKGFMVLDHKPQHIIVRRIGDRLLRRDGRLVYAIIDFELLERTDAYRATRAPARSSG